MRFTSLMMYISSVLGFVFYVYITGFALAAPRISLYDASPISTDTPRRLPDSRFALTPLSAIVPPGSAATRTPQTATLSPATKAIADSGASRLTPPQKRSADPHASSLSTPEKILQTMTSVVSPRSANDAWSADRMDASVTSMESSQDGLCNCSTAGEGILYPDECNQSTGQCSCLDGYSGLQCEDCEEGYFTNGTSGCLPCTCDSFGAVSHLCDSSGICACKPGVYGPKCDECHPGFFHFSSTGCQPCQCQNQTNYCHPQSGVCVNCEGNTQGFNCEECKPDHYRSPGTPLTEACVPCPCSNASSTGACHTDPSGSPVCDQCLQNHTGPLCDRCSAGFYKASGACVSCDCSGNVDLQRTAQVCHPDTGLCLSCINNTSGARCHLCAPGFSGDALAHNCSRLTLVTTAEVPNSSTSSFGGSLTTARARVTSAPTHGGNRSTTAAPQATLTSLGVPADNTTASLTDVSWTQFNVIILAVIILVVVVLLGFVGGVYTYREYQNRKLNAPFWTIELKEDNISFSSYHDSIPNADVSGLLEDEANEVAPNGQLALSTQGNCYKA
ncbi:multiple epidermal growth factor-like domains protein 9 [Nerophis lumbriciformis]|uniref:multiple epidermal growth factor-like domains protein 9 n=1 Tax=Nerophis lumbriciformis TaxID=546530 RepID=UPI002ADF82CB|nr:multiple epidermal growth factor-like domains protein 9 [Nerophis lumbriciformis]